MFGTRCAAGVANKMLKSALDMYHKSNTGHLNVSIAMSLHYEKYDVGYQFEVLNP